jgi:adhesin transport system membrane fusion protein
MLNITENKIPNHAKLTHRFGSFNHVTNPKSAEKLTYWLLGLFGFIFIMMFMPWTQNIRSSGKTTTLTPQDRPQEIQSMIDGRIEKWFVREGDSIKAGDTIVFITEIKDQYWDPNLLNRTKEQLVAKESTGMAYQNKIGSLEKQIKAEKLNLDLKLKQAKNKVKISRQKISIDSAEVEAAKVAYKIADDQYKRAEKMYSDQGIISLKDLEDRRNKKQEAAAKLISAENKLANAQQDLINTTIELNAIESEYFSKIFKIESEIQSANSELFKTDEEISKLNNQYANYSIRSRYWYITAPKDGQIVKIGKSGIGENIKQGESIVTITALNPSLAVELYINPVDVPLMRINKKVRIIFDGWPTIIFSGWPGASVGTFGGRVAAIDSDISPNGKYRILVKPDPEEEGWPHQVRVGAGAQGIALMNDVPIWYELWRRVNGFPPDFYQPEEKQTQKKK